MNIASPYTGEYDECLIHVLGNRWQRLIDAERLSTETAMWDVSSWDEAGWSSDNGIFEKMLARLKELDGKDRGFNQQRDILIAETAIKNGLTFITADENLRSVTEEFGGQAVKPPRCA